jgi:hypothetical protein
MPDVDSFLDDVVRDLRARLPGLDAAAGRAIEDRIVMLTDYRLSGMEEAGFARLLAILAGGRSPVRLRIVEPQVVARELAARWALRTQPVRVSALT